MKKCMLFFVLLILFLSFVVIFYKAYKEQENYFNLKSVEKTAVKTTTEVQEIPSKYLNYSKESYDAAILENRALVLFFTSNWCTSCEDQDLINKDVFDNLNKEGVIGLKIHILDSETTTETDALAKKFDIVKENSIVILDKTGAVYFKYVGVISKELLNTKIMEVVNK